MKDIGAGVSRETYCDTTVHRAFVFGVDKKEDKGRGKCEEGNADDVLPLEFAEGLGVKTVEDDEVHVDGHGKGPEDICNREPGSCQ